MPRSIALLMGLALIAALGCATPKGGSVAEQRSYTLAMRSEVLRDLEAARPGIGLRLRNASGYAVFSNINVQVFFVGGGQGYGVAHHNDTGEDIYMKMAQLGVGIGAGAKDFRVIFLFHDSIAFQRFVDEGWELGADADAALIAGGDRGVQASAVGRVGSGGASAGGSATSGVGSERSSGSEAVGSRIEVYQLTESGLALKAMIGGTRYYRDAVLN